VRERLARVGDVEAWELVQQAEELWKDAASVYQVADAESASRTLARADSLLARAERAVPGWIEPTLLRGRLSMSQATLAPHRSAVPGALSESADSIDATAWLNRGLDHAGRALARHSSNARALELRGSLRLQLWRESSRDEHEPLLAQAESDLRAAVAADPTLAHAWTDLSEIHQKKGKFAEAEIAAKRALEADAYLTETRNVVNELLFAALERANFESARHWCATGLSSFPGDPRFTECGLTILSFAGRTEADVQRAWDLLDAIEQSDSMGLLEETWGVRRQMVAAVLARAGLTDSARAVSVRAREGGGAGEQTGSVAFSEAYVRTLLGDRDEAIRLLAGYLKIYPRMRDYVANNRWFRPLHGDPRFEEILEAARD
jgi:tetratricopeptide (TPR) repeat protein